MLKKLYLEVVISGLDSEMELGYIGFISYDSYGFDVGY